MAARLAGFVVLAWTPRRLARRLRPSWLQRTTAVDEPAPRSARAPG